MPRRKKFLKLPFFKIRINKKTWANVLGFISFGLAAILLLSFLQSGDVLISINLYLTTFFGGIAILFPIIVFLFGTHFFNSQKLKIIKPHVTLGGALIYLALLGTFQSGRIGRLILDNLRQDFSLPGALLILSITFIIGLILFLNTSVDSFLLFVLASTKTLVGVTRKYIFREFLGKKRDRLILGKDADKQDSEFIQDKKVGSLARGGQQVASSDQSIHIRPISKQDTWVYPPLTLLDKIHDRKADRGDVKKNCDIIEKTLDSFGIRARVSEVNTGPTVTQYALEIVRGTKLSKITSLSNDLALALAATTGQVRIEAPIPGRSLVGIEIPNKKPALVTLKELLKSNIISKNPSSLLVPMGLDVSGKSMAVDVGRMPHMLIAGTTGAGKSVLLNAWICTYLFRTKPEELRFILVDPKRVELTLYNGVPHLLTEVIVDPKKIISALKWTVAEMEKRYKIFAQAGARNIERYNELKGIEKIPYIVFVVDELADLMAFASRDAEELITRIAQMARATGIHLILATQRPSVDVITGLMKANIPARIAFNVSSMIDSRVVLDMPGAEKLLGRGDMLFLPPDQAKPRRIQGPLITESEVNRVIDFLKKRAPEVHYTEEVTTQTVSAGARGRIGTTDGDKDPLFDQAVDVVYQEGKGSASLLQRRLSIGYARAARILDQLEAAGYVGPAEGSKPRLVIQRQTQENIEQ